MSDLPHSRLQLILTGVMFGIMLGLAWADLWDFIRGSQP